MKEPLETLSKQELIALLKQQKQAQIQAAASIKKTHQQALQKELQKAEIAIRKQQKKAEKQEEKLRTEQQKVAHLQLQVDQLKRLLYGQKRERFEGNPDQLALPFQADEQYPPQQLQA